ncbi:MAG: hypothetical protein ACE5GW_12030, partial [Planctomycetota bacterium]
MSMPFPRIVLIGGGVAALLLAPLLFISPPPAEEGEAEATGAPITPELEREILAREEALRGDDDLSRHLLDFKVQRARPLPEEAYGRFLDALDERHERRLDRVSLRLYGELLDLQARRGLRAPELGTRLMRLRHAALLLGDRSFLDRVAGSVMTYSRLDERLEGLEGHGEHDPGFELAAAHHAILTEHWDAALEALESVLSSDGVAPRQDSWEALAEGLAAARTLARVAGSAPSARAQELLEELL